MSASVSAAPAVTEQTGEGTVTLPAALLDELLSAALRVVVETPNSRQHERLAGAHHDVELAWLASAGVPEETQ